MASEYMYASLPPSMQQDRWWVFRYREILTNKHKMVSVLTKAAGYRPDMIVNESLHRLLRTEIFDVLQVMTMVTMTLFLLALFYDLQSPVDDGYCGTMTDETSCLAKRTLLDPNVYKYIWSKQVTHDDYAMVAMVTLSSSVTGVVLARNTVDKDEPDESQYCELNTCLRYFVKNYPDTDDVSTITGKHLDGSGLYYFIWMKIYRGGKCNEALILLLE
jgi:hypothetical protein